MSPRKQAAGNSTSPTEIRLPMPPRPSAGVEEYPPTTSHPPSDNFQGGLKREIQWTTSAGQDPLENSDRLTHFQNPPDNFLGGGTINSLTIERGRRHFPGIGETDQILHLLRLCFAPNETQRWQAFCGMHSCVKG